MVWIAVMTTGFTKLIMSNFGFDGNAKTSGSASVSPDESAPSTTQSRPRVTQQARHRLEGAQRNVGAIGCKRALTARDVYFTNDGHTPSRCKGLQLLQLLEFVGELRLGSKLGELSRREGE